MGGASDRRRDAPRSGQPVDGLDRGTASLYRCQSGRDRSRGLVGEQRARGHAVLVAVVEPAGRLGRILQGRVPGGGLLAHDHPAPNALDRLGSPARRAACCRATASAPDPRAGARRRPCSRRAGGRRSGRRAAIGSMIIGGNPRLQVQGSPSSVVSAWWAAISRSRTLDDTSGSDSRPRAYVDEDLAAVGAEREHGGVGVGDHLVGRRERLALRRTARCR